MIKKVVLKKVIFFIIYSKSCHYYYNALLYKFSLKNSCHYYYNALLYKFSLKNEVLKRFLKNISPRQHQVFQRYAFSINFKFMSYKIDVIPRVLFVM